MQNFMTTDQKLFLDPYHHQNLIIWFLAGQAVHKITPWIISNVSGIYADKFHQDPQILF